MKKLQQMITDQLIHLRHLRTLLRELQQRDEKIVKLEWKIRQLKTKKTKQMKRLLLMLTFFFLTIFVNAQKQLPKDTTKKAEPVYVLVGNLPDFQLLYTAIKSPGDITPNQLKALSEWIEKKLQ